MKSRPFVMHPWDAAEHAIGFASRVEPLTYDELWEWCRRAPYFTARNGLGHLRLIRDEHLFKPNGQDRPSVAENEGALLFPLMLARVFAVTVGVP